MEGAGGECVCGRPMPSVGAEGRWLGGLLGAVVCASSFVCAVRCACALRHGAATCYDMLPCSETFAYSVRLGSIGHYLGRGHGFSVCCYGGLLIVIDPDSASHPCVRTSTTFESRSRVEATGTGDHGDLALI